MLVVKEVNLKHENHSVDQQTYAHYPENVRLSEEDIQYAKNMIDVDGDKSKIKMVLLEKLEGQSC